MYTGRELSLGLASPACLAEYEPSLAFKNMSDDSLINSLFVTEASLASRRTTQSAENTARKAPRQARAVATVDSILEATAHLLGDGGFAALSTNRIARRAGVSIGSLYQYFPNKHAVVAALIDRHAEAQMEQLAANLTSAATGALDTAVRGIIEAQLHAKRVDHEMERLLLETVPQTGQFDLHARWNERASLLVEGALAARSDEIRPTDLHLAVFVLVNAVEGIVHGLVLQRPDLISSDALVEEVVQLVLRYLRPDS